MVWPAVIAGAGALLGGVVSAKGALRAQEMQQAFTPEMMALQHNYNMASMDRQYQLNQAQYGYELAKGPALEMAGLRAAGINPMLRYGQGGSGTPLFTGGSTALSTSTPAYQFQNAYGGLGDAIVGASSSAFGARRTEQEIEESRARTVAVVERLLPEIQKVQADTRLSEAQRNTELQRPGQIMQEILFREAETVLSREQLRVLEAQIGNLNAGAFAQMMSGYLSRQTTSTEAMRTQESAVAAERAVTQWFHDQQIYDDEVVGFALRALRAVSGAVFGR